MSDFILDYDILESIAKNSNSLGKRSEEYAEQLESKIINAIENVTGSSSGYLTSSSDSVRDKINALKLKSEAFYHFAEQILNLLEVAEQIDQEVADAIAAGREYFLDHHESLRIDGWKAKLLGLYVDMKNSIPLLGEIADILGGLDAIFESLKDAIKHWYECEGGKYIVEVIKSVLEVGVAIGFLVLAVAALSLPGAAIFAVCGIIGACIGIVNAVTNVATSFRAADAAIDGNPAWAMIYGKQDKLSDVLRQTNFGNGVFNDLSNLGAGAIDITETVCVIAGFAEAGVGVAKLFKGDAFKLLKNKGALNFSDLKSGVKNGILDLKSSIKQGYKDLKSGLKGLDNVEDIADGSGDVIKSDSLGNGTLNEEIFSLFMPDGRKVTDFTHLPGNTGMEISRRLTVDEMTYLTKEHGVEFAQIYRRGTGVNGGGGKYIIYSGDVSSVKVPIGSDVILINHTHPGGTSYPSGADKKLLSLLEQVGSPQRTSEIIPIGKEKTIKFTKNSIK